jgi:hypothetical protein
MRNALLLASLCLTPMYHITAQDETAATAKPAQSAFYKDPISSFDPGEAKASDVVNLLNEQFPDLKFSAEPTTNRIYGRVAKSQVDDIEQFVNELALVADEHRHQQEKLRQEQLDKEATVREREAQILQEQAAERQALREARNVEAGMSAVDVGLNFMQPFGIRMAATQLRNAELQMQKLRATHEPNHPSVRNAELKVEAIKHLKKQHVHLFDRYQFTGFSKEKTQLATKQPAQLVEILRQLRPDLDVQIEGFDEGQVVFRGSDESVAEAERVIKALQDVTRSSDPATLQRQYEKSERSAANIAEQLREAKSGTSPDGKRIGELREHLTNAVQMAFELRLQLQQYQLERAEADLMTARARLILREQIAEQVIERRIAELENKDNQAWAPATHQETITEQAATSARRLENVEASGQGVPQVQGQFGDAKSNWIAVLKKYRVDQEQLLQQVNDLREKLKAATRVGDGFPRPSTSPNENHQRPAFDERKIAPALKPVESPKSATTQNAPDVSEWQSSFGIRFGEVVNLRETESNFRGGIRIASVHGDTLASQAGIQAGDLLVGIHIWETVSLDDLAFVTEQIRNIPEKNGLKFYIVRKGETIFGNLAISKLPATSGPTTRPSSTDLERPKAQPAKPRL